MNFCGWSSFEDLARACGYTNINNTNTECYDIPNGFQELDPQLFILIGEILGNIISGNLPFNVQNALGNWLQLVGQVIETYNAQQQYFQGGPGRYFSTENYNVSNSFCNTSQNAGTNTNKQNKSTDNSSNTKEKSSKESEEAKIKELERLINELKIEIEQIKNEIKS